MKKIIILLICVLVGLLMAACQPEEEPDMSDNDFGALLNEKIEGTKVHLGDVNDFYYTYEWVGYNAEYQRYRFFVEDGKYKFYHEARKIEGDYGWAVGYAVAVSESARWSLLRMNGRSSWGPSGPEN